MAMMMESQREAGNWPGFRFRPTERELLGYLTKKSKGMLPSLIFMPTVVDLYRYDPWDLSCKPFEPLNSTESDEEEEEMYMFVERNEGQQRISRGTPSGWWKCLEGVKGILDSCKKPLGYKKSLRFFEGKPPKGQGTQWLMTEFLLPNSQPQNYVLCKLHKRRSCSSAASTTQSQCSQMAEISSWHVPVHDQGEDPLQDSEFPPPASASASAPSPAFASASSPAPLSRSESLNWLLDSPLSSPASTSAFAPSPSPASAPSPSPASTSVPSASAPSPSPSSAPSPVPFPAPFPASTSASVSVLSPASASASTWLPEWENVPNFPPSPLAFSTVDVAFFPSALSTFDFPFFASASSLDCDSFGQFWER